jgi:predicted ATPase/DNA-binding winged helix-turn-helix (wHTH) protein
LSGSDNRRIQSLSSKSLLSEVKVTEAAAAPPRHALVFGPFRLIPAQQVLLDSGKPVRLGSRALEILIALVERAGELVTKDELVARVWPDTFVEEGNLRVHVAALRRALGDGQAGTRYVANVPGRGYRFVGPISRTDEQTLGEAPARRPDPPSSDLPAPLTRIVGRGDVLEGLREDLARRRFVTLTGAGGIGKTTVALAVTHMLEPSYRDGVHFIDLASITDARLVPSALASAFGVAVRSETPLPSLISYLVSKEVLIVLDSCEHVIEAAASLSEQLFKSAPGVHVLATSREPLRAEGERVVRLAPLRVPEASADITAAESLTFSAIQLFVERATASLDNFELTDGNTALVADICRRLDGMALAIEMAAGRLDTFSLAEISSLLDDRFRLLTRGRRTALARHQTLRATLDWSHGLLPEFERLVLRRIGIFAGWFTAQAACAVLADQNVSLIDVSDGIAELIAKSLATADVGGPVTFYRLLNTTRAYALDKLREAGEIEAASRRHAEYYRELFKRAEAEWESRPTADWLLEYRRKLDDLRAALDWAFSASGDSEIGVRLTVSATPLWLELSLMEECRARMEQALRALHDRGSQDERQRMQVYAALGWTQMYTSGAFPQTASIWAKALELAEKIDDADYQLRALWGQWANSVNKGRFREALGLAKTFCTVATNTGEGADLLVGERMMGATLHFLGDQRGARRHTERMLASYLPPPRRSHLVRFQFDQQITARYTLARVLWLQGLADQAMLTVESNIAHARHLGHTLSLCNALAQSACPVALLSGNLPAAQRFTELLLELTVREALDVWHAYGECFQGQLLVRRGDSDDGVALLRAGIDKLRKATFVQYLTAFLASLAEVCGSAGHVREARVAIDEALARCEESDERWCIAELLRIKGEIALREEPGDGSLAEQHLFHALDWSRQQEAPAWELRAGTSLSRLRKNQGRVKEARDLLMPIYAQFTEGFDTADLKTAKTLLDGLAR